MPISTQLPKTSAKCGHAETEHADRSPRNSPELRKTVGAVSCRCYSCTITGSPTLTALKYHSASAGLRLMQPWLTFSSPSELRAHGAECTKRPRLVIRTA